MGNGKDLLYIFAWKVATLLYWISFEDSVLIYNFEVIVDKIYQKKVGHCWKMWTIYIYIFLALIVLEMNIKII